MDVLNDKSIIYFYKIDIFDKNSKIEYKLFIYIIYIWIE
jgi:hypothetical protein